MLAFNPFGLRPVFHPSGTIRPTEGTVITGLATNIFTGSPVALDPATGGLILAAAGAGTRAIGAFQGVEFTPADGRRRYSNTWPANQVATEIVAYYTRDAQIIYEIQANGPIVVEDIGEMASWTANGSANGNTTTGLSTVGLDVATLAAAADQFQILGIPAYPDNVPGDAFTIVNGRIMQHQLVADSPVV